MKSYKEFINEAKVDKIWKGGCSGPFIEGMATANCGAQFVIKGSTYEVMGSKYSSHPTNIISLYLDNKGKKVEISGWLLEDDDYDNMSFGIAFYPDYSSTCSSRYTQKISSKWEGYLAQIKEAHEKLFKGKWGVKKN